MPCEFWAEESLISFRNNRTTFVRLWILFLNSGIKQPLGLREVSKLLNIYKELYCSDEQMQWCSCVEATGFGIHAAQ